MKYIIEFYAGSYFGGWNQSTDAPDVYETYAQAEAKVTQLRKHFPRRSYQITEVNPNVVE
jgi:hypothetical protein